MHEELFAIARHYEDNCSNCKEICCANMLLDIDRNDIKDMSKHLKIPPIEFRRKYTKMLSNIYKNGKSEIFSAAGKKQADRNPRILMFNMCSIDDIKLSDDQKNRLSEISDDSKEIGFSLCPFYDKKTHMCKVHPVRPGACYTYPFDVIDKKTLDLRKVNACVISTNFLRRFQEFIARVDDPIAQKYVQIIQHKIRMGEYSNHYHIPLPPVFIYIIYECKKLGIRISPEFKRNFEILESTI